MAEHTPERFHIHSARNRDIAIHTEYTDEAGHLQHFHIATIERRKGQFMPEVDWDAYAVLMASAPEQQAKIDALYEALKELLDYSGGADNALEDEYVTDRARAALAKAEQS